LLWLNNVQGDKCHTGRLQLVNMIYSVHR